MAITGWCIFYWGGGGAIPYKSNYKTHTVQPLLRTGFQFCAANRKECEHKSQTRFRKAYISNTLFIAQ